MISTVVIQNQSKQLTFQHQYFKLFLCFSIPMDFYTLGQCTIERWVRPYLLLLLVRERSGQKGQDDRVTPRPTLSWERQAGEKVEVCACSHMQLHMWTWIPFLSHTRLTRPAPPLPVLSELY